MTTLLEKVLNYYATSNLSAHPYRELILNGCNGKSVGIMVSCNNSMASYEDETSLPTRTLLATTSSFDAFSASKGALIVEPAAWLLMWQEIARELARYREYKYDPTLSQDKGHDRV